MNTDLLLILIAALIVGAAFNDFPKKLHKLFNPHCEACHQEMIEENASKIEHELLNDQIKREEDKCETCEVLKVELEAQRFNNRELLRTIIEMNLPEKVVQVSNEETKPITPKHIPWAVKKAALENEDRATAKILRERAEQTKKDKVEEAKTTEQLEKELLGDSMEEVNG